VEPIEINTGRYYLRALRADDRLDDRPAIVEAFADDQMRTWVPDYRIGTRADADAYIARRAHEWADGLRCSWAIAEPTTGALLGEVGLRDLDLAGHTAEASCWTHPAYRGRGVAVDALSAAMRFGFGGLGLTAIRYGHAEGNTASRRVAEKCGFRLTGRHVEDLHGQPTPFLVWLATTP
jgi:RimJ/RimL family protein N-acetyltransferase